MAYGTHCCPNFFLLLLPDQGLCIGKNMCTLHISDYLENAYIGPLLPNNTVRKTFLHKSQVVRSADWVFNTGTSTWRCVGEYVTLGKMFYSRIFKQEVEATPSYFHYFPPCTIPFRGLY